MTDRERAPSLNLTPEIPTLGEELRRTAGILELTAFKNPNDERVRKHMVDDLRIIAGRVDQMLTLEIVRAAFTEWAVEANQHLRAGIGEFCGHVASVSIDPEKAWTRFSERLRQQTRGETAAADEGVQAQLIEAEPDGSLRVSATQHGLRIDYRRGNGAECQVSIPWSEVDRHRGAQLTLEMVEQAVSQARGMLNDPFNDWTSKQREGGHAALDLFRLCLRQQMGGGQE